MRLLQAVMLRMVLAWALLMITDPVAAQSLTDAVQTGRMTVLAIDYDAGRVVCLGSDGRLQFDEVDRAALVVTVEGRGTDLRLLKTGDVIRAEKRDGRIYAINVLRHAWSELESPEG